MGPETCNTYMRGLQILNYQQQIMLHYKQKITSGILLNFSFQL
jgi:hypothetical protein